MMPIRAIRQNRQRMDVTFIENTEDQVHHDQRRHNQERHRAERLLEGLRGALEA
jgi:hypothetical protein